MAKSIITNKKITREDAIKALKKAIEHKREALQRTKEQWAREGIKGNVVSL